MRKLWFVLLLSGSFVLAQDSKPSNPGKEKSKVSKGPITVQGCVGTEVVHGTTNLRAVAAPRPDFTLS